MIFYYSGSPATSLSLSEVVPSLSLGNIGQSETACASGIFDPDTEFAEISLKCPFGKLSHITNFGQVSIDSYIACKQAKEYAQEEGIDLSEYDFGFYPELCSYREFEEADKADFD